MKHNGKGFYVKIVIVSIMSICLFSFLVVASGKTETIGKKAGIEVSKNVLCKQIKDRQPVETSVNFPANIGTVYFYTIINADEIPTTVKHEWYYGGKKVAEVILEVKYPITFTWSSICILPEQIGDWKVNIVDLKGTILKDTGFTVLPHEEEKTALEFPAITPPRKTAELASGESTAGKKEPKEPLEKRYEYSLKPGFLALFGGGDAVNSFSYETANGRGSGRSSGEMGGAGTGLTIGINKNKGNLKLGGTVAFYYGKWKTGRSASSSQTSDVEILDYEKTKVLQANFNTEYLFRIFYLVSTIGLTSYTQEYYAVLNKDTGVRSFNADNFNYSSSFPMLGLGFGWRLFPRYTLHPIIELKYWNRLSGILNGHIIQGLSLTTGINFDSGKNTH